MNKVRKLAEELVEKHPKLFSTDFNENKLAMGKVLTIRNRALRNQIAGLISIIVREQTPKTSEVEEEDATSPTMEEATSAASVSQSENPQEAQPSDSTQETPAQNTTAAS